MRTKKTHQFKASWHVNFTVCIESSLRRLRGLLCYGRVVGQQETGCCYCCWGSFWGWDKSKREEEEEGDYARYVCKAVRTRDSARPLIYTVVLIVNLLLVMMKMTQTLLLLFSRFHDCSGGSLHMLLNIDWSQLLFHALDRLVQHDLGSDL